MNPKSLKVCPRVIGLALLILIPLPRALAAADGEEIVIEVTTSQDRYLLGEWLHGTVTKCNPTPNPITLTHGCPCCHDRIQILDADGNMVKEVGSGCTQAIVVVTWDPGECKSKPFIWHQNDQSGEPVAAGQYRVHHRFQFPDFTTTTTSEDFTITSEIQPQTNAFIDFESLPDGSPDPHGPVGSWYLSQNARFYELGYGYRQPRFRAGDDSDGIFAGSTSTTHPPGFNVVVEFKIPVDFVAADVMTAADHTVTMSAFDVSDQLLDTVESASSAELWKGRLALESPVGIARVEWFPSNPQATVGIDNLEYGQTSTVVDVPALDEKGNAALVLLLLAAGWAVLRRFPKSAEVDRRT